MNISPDLEKNHKNLTVQLDRCYDLVMKKINWESSSKNNFLLIYFDTLIDKEWVFDNVIKPLNYVRKLPDGTNGLRIIKENHLETGGIKDISTFKEILDKLTNGNVILLYQGSETGLAINLPGWKIRNVEEPQGEVVVTGPKEGFIETLNINIGLLRRRFKASNLKAEVTTIGNTGNTNVAVIYLDNTVNQKILSKVRKRLSSVQLDLIIDSSNIEHLIEDQIFSPFPQLLKTERPDQAAVGLSQGRVAILMEGSPHALLIPGLFVDFLHSIEDYYHRFYFSLAILVLRYIMYGFSLLLPALYIAITTYHPEMIPTPLLITLASSRTGVPFPALVEAILMEIVFEALREAGIRLPKAIGPAITIVGALVIGEAAVTAGIVSQPMVIVVAITGIASFTIPGYDAAISTRLLRFPIMFLGASLGIFGILIALLILAIHLASIESFGIPYLSLVNPLPGKDLPGVLKVPFPIQNAWRKKFAKQDKKKQNNNQ